MECYFPFGQKLNKVEQKDRSHKKAFVLGVYASAVHATWKDMRGKVKVRALAVASEPEIFWTGKGANEIIEKIKIPAELGSLELPNEIYNGPSGRALDKNYLSPLGLTRENTWLCDIIPFSRMNSSQSKAIEGNYKDKIVKYNLTEPTIPSFKKSELNSEDRRIEILKELKKSEAELIILLGDEPIRHFLYHYSDQKYLKLSDFGNTVETYGKIHNLKLDGREYRVIPLCHPRQSDRLGRSSKNWGALHDVWMKRKN